MIKIKIGLKCRIIILIQLILQPVPICVNRGLLR